MKKLVVIRSLIVALALLVLSSCGGITVNVVNTTSHDHYHSDGQAAPNNFEFDFETNANETTNEDHFDIGGPK